MNDPERVVIGRVSFQKRALFAGMVVGAAGASLAWLLFNEVVRPLLFGW